MESMEEDRFEVSDDHNHNYCAPAGGDVHTDIRKSQLTDVTSSFPQPLPYLPARGVRERPENREKNHPKATNNSQLMDSDSSSEGSEVCESDIPASAASGADKMSTNSTSKFLLNAMAVDDYRKNHWPNLEKAIDLLLIQKPTDHISISYAQIYSYVYKCVCQQHSELLYKDLTQKIISHLNQVSSRLEVSRPEDFIENFNLALSQYTASLQCIVPVFMYMNKFYIEAKLNRDLGEELMKWFADYVAEKHVKTLMPLLTRAHSMPFQVQPSTMANVVKGLYSLRPEWAQLAPALFSGFIPQIHPPATVSQLPHYAAHDQKLQLELSMNGFPRGDQSRKRSSEDS
ncbi:CDK2-associated and cullin domain-containing protein 1 isoform X1 [Gadus macrocephalus]|uniref:CDK2-associated and cullin domain-containing protein 1 isoform X1 n=1 Tax=Gadus macrocephalus TaxID=80720 RepID=UPI0028CB701E|nr:CDK2-associated and cullin domain-containing protein 1 isoform X1 [Gadus macrocephalus]